MKIINLGCGEETYGNTRVDIVRTNATTDICNLDNKFPFPDEEYDEIYCRNLLEHIGNVKQFISESMRILKKGGKFWFKTDNGSYLGFVLRSHQGYCKYEDWNKDDKHYCLFKKEHLVNLFGNKAKITYTYPNWKMWFLPSWLKCMHIEIRGTK